MLDHMLDRLAELGVARAIVNVHHLRRPDRGASRGPRTPAHRHLGRARASCSTRAAASARSLPLLGAEPFLICNTDALWIEGPTLEPAPPRRPMGPRADGRAAAGRRTATSVGVDWAGDFTMDEDGPADAAPRNMPSRPSSMPASASSSRELFAGRARGGVPARAVLLPRPPSGPPVRHAARRACGCMSARPRRSREAEDAIERVDPVTRHRGARRPPASSPSGPARPFLEPLRDALLDGTLVPGFSAARRPARAGGRHHLRADPARRPRAGRDAGRARSASARCCCPASCRSAASTRWRRACCSTSAGSTTRWRPTCRPPSATCPAA